MIDGIVIVASILAGYGAIAAVAALLETLFPWPPRHDPRDAIPPPNVRCQRSGRESH